MNKSRVIQTWDERHDYECSQCAQEDSRDE